MEKLEAWPAHWLDCRTLPGGLDFIGDVHGCAGELEKLLTALGYSVHWSGVAERREVRVQAPAGRHAVLLGDIVDRGPRIADALRLARAIVHDGAGFCVIGNHDHWLVERLRGATTRETEGLQSSLAALEPENLDFRRAVIEFVMSLPGYIWFDEGKIVASHAGLRAEMIGENSAEVYDFAVRREARGVRQSIDQTGHWAASYRGTVTQVYGHYRVISAHWASNTICLDTACVYGGALSALRWPENELMSVPAAAMYSHSHKTGRPTPPDTQQFVSI